MPQPPSTMPIFDPAAAYPDIVRIRSALIAAEWPAVRDIYHATGWAGRSILADAVGQLVNAERLLPTTAASDLTDTVPATLRASYLIRAGWRARTDAAAAHVGADQFAQFHDYLRRAEQLLIEVTARDPGNVIAWELRLLSARGLELGQAEARRRYDRGARVEAHHLPAQQQLLQQLCPKWGGDLDRMHTFAHDCALAAPEGAPNAVLVAIGHLEHWATLDEAAGARYLRADRVRAEIEQAAARSVWHPRFARQPGWVEAHNIFAAVLSLAGDYVAAAAHFRQIGDLACEFPWAYLGEQAEAFASHRRSALRKGGA